MGTDDTKRDVVARVIYGFRLSIIFALIVTTGASVIGIVAGAVQGYFGGWIDLVFQTLHRDLDRHAFTVCDHHRIRDCGPKFLAVGIPDDPVCWPSLVGVVRAEFFPRRNLEYVRAAKALGVSDRVIMFRHMLPNAMVATVTMLPFLITGAIGRVGVA